MNLTNLTIQNKDHKEEIINAVGKLPENFTDKANIKVEGSKAQNGRIDLCFGEDVIITIPTPSKTGYFDCTVAYTSFTHEKTNYMLFFH